MLLNQKGAGAPFCVKLCFASVARAQVESKTGLVFHVEQNVLGQLTRVAKTPDFDKNDSDRPNSIAGTLAICRLLDKAHGVGNVPHGTIERDIAKSSTAFADCST
jgi:hypothetical protein